MRRRAIACLCLFVLAGCAAHQVRPIIITPAPVLIINPGLQDDAEICVPRAVFSNMGLACMTVGELRALLRSRRDVAAFGVTR